MISDHSASPEGAGTQAGGVGAWPDETPSMDMCSPSMALAAVRNAVSSLAKYAASPAISHRLRNSHFADLMITMHLIINCITKQ